MRYILILLLLVSCSPEQRLQRLIKKHPDLIKTETKIDTIYINSVSVDTIFKQTSDTVTIKENKLTMKYFYNNSDSTVYLSGHCKDSTIIVETVKTTVNPGDSWEDTLKNNIGLLGFLLIMLVVLANIYFIRKRA